MSAGFKIIIVGDSSTGKTSILDRLLNDSFIEGNIPTIGIEFKTYHTVVNEVPIKLNIWDTAGQERYRSVAKSYFRNAAGALLVFSIADYESFSNCKTWLSDLQAGCLPNAVFILVGNKKDLEKTRQVTEEEAQGLAKRHGIEYIETSALTSENIVEAFYRLAQSVHNRTISGSLVNIAAPPSISEQETRETNEEKKGCC
jgi:small GTP-binding protein